MSYSLKLQDPRWQRKRLEILQRDNFQCKGCNSTDKALHVHHNYYEYGIEPWDYNDDCYDTLCYECHYDTSIMSKEIKNVLKFARFRRLAELRNLIVMSEHLDNDDLIEVRKLIVTKLINKGIEIEDGAPL